MADLVKLEKFVTFYLELSGVEVDKIDYQIELGIMRYLIAFGNTTVQSFESKNGKPTRDLEKLERDKYSVYSNFSKGVKSGSNSDVIEFGWDQIEVIEAGDSKPSEPSLKES